MSNRGAGAYESVPAAAVDATLPLALAAVPAALAVGVVFVGGVALVQAGKGLLACGRRVDDAIRAHAAKQEAIFQRCKEYERCLVEGARESVALSGQAQRRGGLLQRIAARHSVANRPVAAPPPIDAGPDVLVGERPALELYHPYGPDALTEETEQLARQADRLQQRLDSLRSEQWQGLVDTGGLAEELAAIRKDLEGAATAPEASLYDLGRRLQVLEAEIGFRMNEGWNRQKERQEAANALKRAADRLSKCAGELAEPEWAGPLAVGEEVLAQADALFARGDLAGAREMAQAAEEYVDQLRTGRDRVRRSNLEVAIAALKEYVDRFQFAPDDPAPGELRQQIAAAEDHLRHDALQQCWQTLQRAQKAADDLAVEVERRSRAAYRKAALELARQTLEEMGYSAEAPRVRESGAVWFRATHPDGTAFVVEITEWGILRYKTEGFDDLRCHEVAARFFQGLRNKGMAVNLQSEFNMLAAARQAREALLRQGYTLVEERGDEEGRFIELTAYRKGEQPRQVTVGADGALPEDIEQGRAPALAGDVRAGAGGALPEGVPEQQSTSSLLEYWRRYWVQRMLAGRVRA